MHKDDFDDSRFAADGDRRHHRTRWAMAFYYPQDTPIELGATAILPRTQYLNTATPSQAQELPLSGPAGTVAIVHYDLLHRAMANQSDKTRHMVKFVFTRMSEPQGATWDHRDGDWEPTDDPQDGIWQHLWNWYRSAPDTQSRSDSNIEQLTRALADENEVLALKASYEIGLHGKKAIPALVDALKTGCEAARRNAAYTFNRIGQPAVPALLEAVKNTDERVRARSIDVLGDMGLEAATATDSVIASLDDDAKDVRGRAAEALGTIAQRRDHVSRHLSRRLDEDESDFVRRNAALSLARLGPKAADAVPVLTKSMRDDNHYVRGYAVCALDRIGTPEATKAALNHLQTMQWDAAGSWPAG